MQLKDSFSKEKAPYGVPRDFPARWIPCPVVSMCWQQGAGLHLLPGASQAALGCRGILAHKNPWFNVSLFGHHHPTCKALTVLEAYE